MLKLAGSLAFVGIVGCAVGVGAFVVPACLMVSEALSRLPEELRPPPPAFVRVTRCIHPGGVSVIAARRLLQSQGPLRGRALTWAARLLASTWAIELVSPDGGMGLFANTMIHEAGSGLSAGARASFDKSPAELSESEAFELLLVDIRPDGVSERRREELRLRCLSRGP